MCRRWLRCCNSWLMMLGVGLALIGAFAAIYHPIGTALLVDVAGDKPGQAIGLNGVFGNIGVAMAPMVTAFVAFRWGWHWAFIIPGVLCTGVGLFWMREPIFDVASRRSGRAFPAIPPQLGVDTTHFAPRKNAALRAEFNWRAVVIGYAGRLVAEKGLRVLMRALEQVRGDFQLVLLGRGPLAAEISAWGAGLPSGQRVHIQATVPHADVPQWMNAMDLLVLPSLTTNFWIEQFGHVLIEGMACGLPVVVSDSGAMAQVVGAAGTVVPEGDVPALAAALQQLVDNAQRREMLGAAGRARVLAQFTHAEVAQQTYAFLQQVVAAPM